MDAFENLVSLLLRREGYWTATSVKVELTKEQKRQVGRPSSPRWEIDLVAYRGSTNELLAVECKSYLDSPGVCFRGGQFDPTDRYKLFCEPQLRDVVLKNLAAELVASKACAPDPMVKLCLATGKIATSCEREELAALFDRNGWGLFDPAWIKKRLSKTADAGYENDIVYVVAKILGRVSDVG